MTDNTELATALAKHQRRSTGMTGTSPDTCVCGERIMPVPSTRWDDCRDISDRRDEAFAAHQALAARPVITDTMVNNVALALLGPSVSYDREKLRAALKAVFGETHQPTERQENR